MVIEKFTNIFLDEGPLATTSLEDISSDLEKRHRNVCQNSQLYQVNYLSVHNYLDVHLKKNRN